MHFFRCKPFVGVITGVVVGLESAVERKLKIFFSSKKCTELTVELKLAII